MQIRIISLVVLVLVVLSNTALALDTLGVSRVDFSSNVPELNKPGFIINTVENGRVEEFVYNELKQDAQASVPSGIQVKQGGTISGRITSYSLNYPVIYDNSNIYYAEVAGDKYFFDVFSSSGIENVVKWCESLKGNGEFVVPLWDFNVFHQQCIRVTSIGKIARIDTSSRTKFTEEINVRLDDGKAAPTLIISDTQQQVKSGDGNVYVSWSGNLGTLQGQPIPSVDYKAIYTPDGVMLTDRITTDEYKVWAGMLKSKLTNNPTGHVDSTIYCQENMNVNCVASGTGQYRIPGMIASINAKRDIIQKRTSYGAYDTSISFDGAKNTGMMTIKPPSMNLVTWAFPQFKIIINADWVGIYRPVGKPVIISSSSPCFIEGQTGRIDLKIKNDATVSASFGIGVVCDSGFTAISQNPIQFNAGETKSITYFVTGETASKRTGNCRITVVDANNPASQYTATKDQPVCITEANQCSNVGVTACEGKTLRKCDTVNGVNVWVPLKECEICETIGGVAQCTTAAHNPVCGDSVCVKGKEDVKGGEFYCASDCEIPTWYWVVGGAIVLLVATAIILKKRRKRR